MTPETENNVPPEYRLIVDAILRDVGIPAPKPGIADIVSLMRYDVLEVIRGEYSEPSIFVGHHLPNLLGSEFRIDICHRLFLTDQFPRHVGILDKFQTDLSTKKPFFCLSFEVLEHRLGADSERI